MSKKTNHIFRQIINSVILAGGIVFLIGSYYCVVKAGIPYQDPPLDLWIQYEVNARIGDILMANGFKIIICGAIIRLLFGLVMKIHQRKGRGAR